MKRRDFLKMAGLAAASARSLPGFRRIDPSVVSTLQQLPLFDSRGAIHLQKADCYPARGSQANDFGIAKLMVVIPTIKAWMK